MGLSVALFVALLLLIAPALAQQNRKRQTAGCAPDSYQYYSSPGSGSSSGSWYYSYWTFPPCPDEPTQRPNLTTPSPVRTPRPSIAITTGYSSSEITTGRTPPPETTIPPPAAPCSLNAISYRVHAKYFLQGVRSSVQFCAKPKVKTACDHVEWTVNGRGIGSSDDGCITYDTGLVTQGSIEMEAVGVNNDNDKGVPVSLFLPVFTLPTWFLVLFGNPGINVFGSGDSWGYRDNAEIFAPFSAVIEQHLPIIGCKFRLGMNAEALFQVQDSGSATVEGNGGIQVNIEPDTAPIAGGKVRVVMGGEFGVRSLGKGLFEPKLEKIGVGINGEVAIPTPWVANYMTTVPVVGAKVGIKIFFLVIVGANIKANFEFEESRRPLPIKFESVSGGLTLGMQVSGECSLWASTLIGGRGTVTPMLSWSSEGFAFNGVALQAIVSVQFTVFGKEITIYPISGTWTCTRSGCSRSGKKRDDESDDLFTLREDMPSSEWLPITTKWNPTITAQAPLTVSNVYPSGSVVVESVNGHEMLTFLTMGTNTQVMYSTRLSDGLWSDLAIVPPASSALDFPALSSVPTTNSFLLVAAQSDSADSLTSAHLVYSTFATNLNGSSSWTAYQPLLPAQGAPTAGTLDLMPVISQDGTMVAFLRIEGNSKLIMTTRFSSLGWAVPMDVTDIEASAFAFDCLATGEAIMAFSNVDTNVVTICYLAVGSNNWACSGTSKTSNAKLSVLAIGINFVVISGTDSAIVADLYNGAGNLVTTNQIPVAQAQRLTVAQSSNGNSLAVIGWETSTATNSTFHYALVGQDGSILSSPSLKIEHISPNDAFWAPVATSLEADGEKLLYASMLRSANADGSYNGLLTVRELAFAAEASISNVTFNPVNWLSSIVTVYATLHNNGLAPLNINGKGSVVFSLINGGNSTVLNTVSLGTVSSGESVKIVGKLTLADAMPLGGMLSVAYSGIDVFNAQPYVTDPCKYQLRDSSLISTKDGAKALVTLYATGICATNVILSASYRGNDGVTTVVGSRTVTISPNYKKTLEIPISNPTAATNTMIVSVKGLRQEVAVISIVEASSYDFGFLPRTFKVDSAKPGAVAVSVAVTNGGSTSATGVPVVARLLASDGSSKEIASVLVSVAAHETGQTVTMTLALNAEVNNVQFVINDPAAPTFPEVYTANNIFNAAVMVPGGSDKGSYVNPENKSRNRPSDGRIGIIAVCVLFAVAVLAVAGATVAIYLRTRGVSAASSKAASGSYEPVTLQQ